MKDTAQQASVHSVGINHWHGPRVNTIRLWGIYRPMRMGGLLAKVGVLIPILRVVNRMRRLLVRLLLVALLVVLLFVASSKDKGRDEGVEKAIRWVTLWSGLRSGRDLDRRLIHLHMVHDPNRFELVIRRHCRGIDR
jgi:hypothetical protein